MSMLFDGLSALFTRAFYREVGVARRPKLRPALGLACVFGFVRACMCARLVSVMEYTRWARQRARAETFAR